MQIRLNEKTYSLIHILPGSASLSEGSIVRRGDSPKVRQSERGDSQEGRQSEGASNFQAFVRLFIAPPPQSTYQERHWGRGQEPFLRGQDPLFLVEKSHFQGNKSTRSVLNRLKRIIDCNPSRNFNNNFDKVIF